MAAVDAACPKGHTGEEYRVVKDGYVETRTGTRQLLRCISTHGTAHRFRGGFVEPVVPAPIGEAVRCPKAGHKDATIRSKGTRVTRTGTWRRFECLRPNGERHWFKVMQTEVLTPVSPAPPPECGEHPGSKVTRNGTFGLAPLRQRYLCRPADGKAHQFTPPLTRQVVAPGVECQRCDELLSPHHGPITAARSTTWTLVGVANALNSLSLGDSYANVSLALRAQRDAARAHLLSDHGLQDDSAPAAKVPAIRSYTRRDRRNAWRVAADLVEQYSPLLFADVDARYRAEAQASRDRNDAALAANPNAPLATPLVYVVDDMPIWTVKGAQQQGKLPSWHVLAVVEIGWRDPEDPFAPYEPMTRLRLARALPRINADAWQVVLSELGVRPDFVVADGGSGLKEALTAFYGVDVPVQPSMWHIHRNLRDALEALPNTTFMNGKEKVLIDPLRKQLSQLARDELLGRTDKDVERWWDELEAIVAALPAPVATIVKLRSVHEPRIKTALEILNLQPQVPASNASVENRLRLSLKPFLDDRKHLFGNQERTNRLLNLLVCREAGVFTDMDTLTLRIRQFNETTGGWAPAPRQILDRQLGAASRAAGRRYESLKARSVVTKLAKAKGITTTVETRAATPPPNLSKQRAQTLELLPIREWARKLGLPAGVTGPIKDAVKAAYEAYKNGATEAQARAVYDREEKARIKAWQATRAAKVTSSQRQARTRELAEIRQWCAEQGIELPSNGYIPPEVWDAFEAHKAGTSAARRPSKRPKKKGTA